MDKYIIKGGKKLFGEVEISGAKNAAVAIIPAALMVAGVCRIENLPQISDTDKLLDILALMGAKIRLVNKNTVDVDCTDVYFNDKIFALTKEIRASYYLIGSMLGRFGAARTTMPGGCNFGVRPIDQHIKGMKALGATMNIGKGLIRAEAKDGRLKGARVYLDQGVKGETPLSLEGLAPGEHRLRAELAGHDPAARTISIAPGGESTEEFRLRGNVGTITLSTAPAGVEVLIDDRSYGKTSAKPDDSDVVSETLVLSDVPVGDHVLRLVRPGYASAQRSVSVQRGQTLALPTATLERRFLPDVEVRTRHGVYRGVFVESTPEFYRIESRPGLIQSIPQGDILQRSLIRTDATPDETP